MLVCSVVLRPKRGTLAASITETAAALDAPSINAVFAILADDPGAASDTVSAFVGQIMVEAASAAAVADAGSIRNAIIVEETIAAVSSSATITGPSGAIAASVSEPATAASIEDATTVSAIAVAVIDGAFVASAATATILGTEIIDSGPTSAFD